MEEAKEEEETYFGIFFSCETLLVGSGEENYYPRGQIKVEISFKDSSIR